VARNPTSWRRFHELVRAGVIPGDRAPGFNRFAARYSMARQLVTVEFTDLRPAAASGYTEGLRVALAYSALESLERSISGRPGGTHAPSPELARDFREARSAPLRESLNASLINKKLSQRLQALLDDDVQDDVRPIAEGLRHLVFHGVYTPHGAGLARSGHLRKFTGALSVVVLDRVDEVFTNWVDART
jgi:hypothetical protein